MISGEQHKSLSFSLYSFLSLTCYFLPYRLVIFVRYLMINYNGVTPCCFFADGRVDCVIEQDPCHAFI
jgi:hypothetical protein